MRRRSYCLGLFTGLAIIACLSSCQKKEYDNEFTTFGAVYFTNSTTLGINLGVKYEGEPIAWDRVDGKIQMPKGEHTFVFYDLRNGAVLGEKKVSVDPVDPDHFILFQPIDGLPISFLDPNAQAAEAEAPAGYMKIKIANLSQVAIPEGEIDVVFHSTVVSATKFGPVDTLEAIGRNLGTAGYMLVKRGVRANAIQSRYKISFLNHTTGKPLPAAGGADFINAVEFNTNTKPAKKGVYTIYLTDLDRDVNTLWLLRNGKYYDITPNVLFAD